MDTQRPVRTPPPAGAIGGEIRHVETSAEARQGPLGRPILYVLIGGLLLAAIFVIGSQIWSAAEDLPEAGTAQTDSGVAPPVQTPVTPIPAPVPTPAPAP